jgi:hypothetical protein
MKNRSQDNHSPGRDLKPGLPEYETGVLTARPRHSATATDASNNGKTNSQQNYFYADDTEHPLIAIGAI